uniref:PID domain-containing protein n=1 Tax=Panagrellus redivivus TaxID=6233 RepID=A0A7E4VZ72_PANRE
MSCAYVQNTTHIIHYLGQVEITPPISPNNSESEHERCIEELVIEQVETSQLTESKLVSSTEAKLVTVHVSERGLKVIDNESLKVIDRVALHAIVSVTSYDDGFGHYNVVLLLQPVHSTQICHVFQSVTGDLADALCNDLKNAFSAVESAVE